MAQMSTSHHARNLFDKCTKKKKKTPTPSPIQTSTSQPPTPLSTYH